MTKSLISYIADGATVAILSFIAVFTVAKFYLSGTFPSLVVALCVAAAATSAYILVSEKRRGAQLLGRKDAILLERFTLSLLLAEKTVATERIFGYIRKKNYALSPDKNGFFTDDNSFAVCVFKAEPLTADDLLQAVRMTPKDKDLLIIGVGFSDNAKDFAAKFCDFNIVLTP
ncbi:MAG: hypothetical protein J5903_00180, partial [Clostridia bacterium]|nr:hypothetical protein [Clostridia bacterium]